MQTCTALDVSNLFQIIFGIPNSTVFFKTFSILHVYRFSATALRMHMEVEIQKRVILLTHLCYIAVFLHKQCLCTTGLICLRCSLLTVLTCSSFLFTYIISWRFCLCQGPSLMKAFNRAKIPKKYQICLHIRRKNNW